MVVRINMKRLTSLQGNGAVVPLTAAGGRVREECGLFEVGTRGAYRPQRPVASGVPARRFGARFVMSSHHAC